MKDGSKWVQNVQLEYNRLFCISIFCTITHICGVCYFTHMSCLTDYANSDIPAEAFGFIIEDDSYAVIILQNGYIKKLDKNRVLSRQLPYLEPT